MSKRVSRDDIANKLREIQGEVDTAAESAKPAAITIGSVVGVAAVGLAFIFGQRSGRKTTTVVEVRREK